VFLAALGSYGLIKIVPFWGLSLIGTCVLYMAPLLYMKNRGTIKAQLQRIEQVVTRQAYQLKDITAQQASRATETAQNLASDASSKAQQIAGSTKTSGPSMTNSSIRYEDTAPGMSMGNNSRFESASRLNTQASHTSKRLSNDDFPTALRDSVALPHFDDGDLPSVPFQDPGRTTTTSTFPTTTIPASTGPYIREEEIRTKY